MYYVGKEGEEKERFVKYFSISITICVVNMEYSVFHDSLIEVIYILISIQAMMV